MRVIVTRQSRLEETGSGLLRIAKSPLTQGSQDARISLPPASIVALTRTTAVNRPSADLSCRSEATLAFSLWICKESSSFLSVDCPEAFWRASAQLKIEEARKKAICGSSLTGVLFNRWVTTRNRLMLFIVTMAKKELRIL